MDRFAIVIKNRVALVLVSFLLGFVAGSCVKGGFMPLSSLEAAEACYDAYMGVAPVDNAGQRTTWGSLAADEQRSWQRIAAMISALASGSGPELLVKEESVEYDVSTGTTSVYGLDADAVPGDGLLIGVVTLESTAVVRPQVVIGARLLADPGVVSADSGPSKDALSGSVKRTTVFCAARTFDGVDVYTYNSSDGSRSSSTSMVGGGGAVAEPVLAVAIDGPPAGPAEAGTLSVRWALTRVGGAP